MTSKPLARQTRETPMSRATPTSLHRRRTVMRITIRASALNPPESSATHLQAKQSNNGKTKSRHLHVHALGQLQTGQASSSQALDACCPLALRQHDAKPSSHNRLRRCGISASGWNKPFAVAKPRLRKLATITAKARHVEDIKVAPLATRLAPSGTLGARSTPRPGSIRSNMQPLAHRFWRQCAQESRSTEDLVAMAHRPVPGQFCALVARLHVKHKRRFEPQHTRQLPSTSPTPCTFCHSARFRAHIHRAHLGASVACATASAGRAMPYKHRGSGKKAEMATIPGGDVRVDERSVAFLAQVPKGPGNG